MRFYVFTVEQRSNALRQTLRPITDGRDVSGHRSMCKGGRVRETMHVVQTRTTSRRFFLQFEGWPDIGGVVQFLVFFSRWRRVAISQGQDMGRDRCEFRTNSPIDAKDRGENLEIEHNHAFGWRDMDLMADAAKLLYGATQIGTRVFVL